MRVAILGATSQIARDLIQSFFISDQHELVLYARNPSRVNEWLGMTGAGVAVASDLMSFNANEPFDAVINFIGSGSPTQTIAMGASILDVTLKYDLMALDYLEAHPACRYIFLSSGAAYGGNFVEPVNQDSVACVPINRLRPQDWYSSAKIYAECRHRSRPDLSIVDVRVFNYFSHAHVGLSGSLVSDVQSAIASGSVLKTSPLNIVRDFIGPGDFHQLIAKILLGPPSNDAVDCYTLAPVDKMTLLESASDRFGLRFEIVDSAVGVNATGVKINYFSLNKRAAAFGFEPEKTSLQNIIDEFSLALNAK